MKEIQNIFQIAVLSLFPILTNAQVITFEPDANGCLPDGSIAVDDMVISNQFLKYGVSFGIDNNLDGINDTNGYTYLEKVGDDGDNGFQNRSGIFDTAINGTENQLGQYFLRTVAVDPTNDQQVLLVSYVTPVEKASGEIWDLDANFNPNSDPTEQGEEQWNMEALDENGQIITNLLSPLGIDWALPESLDGKPWSFEIKSESDQKISALRICFVGNREKYTGLAFNNFSPANSLGTTNVVGVAKIAPAVEVYWHSQLGKTYQLQWTQGLGEQWHNLGAPLAGTGVEMSATDISRGADNSRRMYRVLETD